MRSRNAARALSVVFGSAVASGLIEKVLRVEVESFGDVASRELEVDVDGRVTVPDGDGTREVAIRGRVDRVDRTMDGGVRAYASDTGAIVWTFDTNREFETVNGVAAKGGAMDGPGPVVSGGMVYVLSGYVSLIGRPGNVLLAFGID